MKTKIFDSVKMMRAIRDNLSKDFSQMTVKEKIKLLEEEFPEIKPIRRQRIPLTTHS